MSIIPANTHDVIDSRDVIQRLNELVADREDVFIHAEPESLTAWDAEHHDELNTLRKLDAMGRGYSPDWPYGATLIRDSYFTEYAQELAEEIGAIKDNAQWPYTCIDWDKAARELQMDYTSIDFDGVDYWVR